MDATGPASPLGEAIRRQRELSKVSMRQFASMAGISNPYLSQIERGLREPSERVLDAIARSLETSTDALYEQAGIAREPDDEDGRDARGDRVRRPADRPPAAGAAGGLRQLPRRQSPLAQLADEVQLDATYVRTQQTGHLGPMRLTNSRARP